MEIGDEKQSWTVTIAEIKRPEARVVRVIQPGTIPARPKWMEGETGYVQSVGRGCPSCQSYDIWRGPWCNSPTLYLVLVRLEPPVKHSGRKRNCACLSCGEFWNDIQAIPYELQDWEDI